MIIVFGLVLLGLSIGSAQAQQDLFEQVGPGLTGVTGGSSSVGDVNNDGNLDIVIVGDSDPSTDESRTATLYLGDGQGGFTEADAGLGSGNSTSFGDVDNDGNLDLLIAGSFNASLYLGDGQGGFTEAEAGLSDVRDEASTSIADVNGDGNDDLLITGTNANLEPSATLYLGDGQGGFSEAEAGLTGVQDGSTSIADFDNDSHLDLLITGEKENDEATTALYLGDGEGNFTEENAGLVGVYKGHTSVGDTDGDGNLDLLITGEKENDEATTTLYLGDGQGGFTEANAELEGVLSGSSSMADLNGDGTLDILVAGEIQENTLDNGAFATLYLGNGQGGFSEAGLDLDGVIEATTAVGDLVGDDSPDLLITGTKEGGDTSATLYRGDGEGGFTVLGPNLLSVSGGSSSFGDFDADGNLDLLITGSQEQGDPTTTLYLGDGTGGFAQAGAGLVGVSSGSSSIGDLNNDGNLDFVITGARGGVQPATARLYLGDGQGGFTEAEAGLTGVSFGGSSSIGDVNNDGNPDLFIAGYDGDEASSTLYLGDGEGGFTKADAGITGVQRSASVFGDVNNDGDLDLVVTGSINGENSTTLYLGDGEGGFSEASAGLADLNQGSISIGDVNDDSNLDLLLGGKEGFSTESNLYLGDGQGGFSEEFADLKDLETSTLGDVNGDGNLDLILSGGSPSSPETILYLGDGSGDFTESANLVGVASSSSALGDIDNDGHRDLVMTGEARPSFGESTGPTSLLYRNLSSGTALAASASRTVGSNGAVDFEETGVAVSFSGTSGSGEVTVQRYSNSPNNPLGISETNISEYRFVISAGGNLSFGGDTQIRLDVSTLGGISDASNVTVYKRDTKGSGSFAPLSTSYDSNANKLVATTGSFSEFVLASDSEPLPVELASFDATVGKGAVTLSWSTASETNNAKFQVQRRTGEQANGGEGAWTTVGSVEGARTTSQARSYRFTDEDLPYEADRLAYRLRQVDTDGSASLSREITVERGVTELELLRTYPNPARQRATVRYALPAKQDVTVRLYDVLGRQVRTVVNGTQEGRHEQAIDVGSLSSGVYFLRLRSDGQTRTQKLTIVR